MDPHKLRDLLWFGNMILILAVLMSSFMIVHQMQNEKEIKIPEPPPNQKISSGPTTKIFDYESIWTLKIAPEKQAEVVEIGPTAEDELRKLLQVDSVAFQGVSKENAYATIKVKVTRKTKLVYIGDVFDIAQKKWHRKGGTPADVVEKAVVVDISGSGVTFTFKNERITLPAESGGGKETKNVSGSSGPSKEISPGVWELAGAEKDKILENPDKYIKEAGVVPYYERGRFAGLKLKKVPEGSLAALRGFKRHDVVKKINGITISSMEQLQAIINREKNKKRFMIHLMRLGKPVTMTFNVK